MLLSWRLVLLVRASPIRTAVSRRCSLRSRIGPGGGSYYCSMSYPGPRIEQAHSLTRSLGNVQAIIDPAPSGPKVPTVAELVAAVTRYQAFKRVWALYTAGVDDEIASFNFGQDVAENLARLDHDSVFYVILCRLARSELAKLSESGKDGRQCAKGPKAHRQQMLLGQPPTGRRGQASRGASGGCDSRTRLG